MRADKDLMVFVVQVLTTIAYRMFMKIGWVELRGTFECYDLPYSLVYLPEH